MKYVFQFGIILMVTFLGEAIYCLLPLPIPASIYGLLIMLFSLQTGIIKLESIRETSKFLLEIMPLLFLPAAVGLITVWGEVLESLLALVVIIISSTIIVMALTGWTSQLIMSKGRKRR